MVFLLLFFIYYYNNLSVSFRLPQKFDEVAPDIMTVIEKFMRDTYFVDNEITHQTLDQLSTNKLMIIASLLLHYTCLHDERIEFRKPLFNLPQSMQQAVTDFLKKFNTNLKRDDLQKFVTNEIFSNRTPVTPNFCYDSPVNTGSPLQEYFRTPISRKRYMDKELKSLKTALELERDEKNDLQEDLKIHQEKIKRLGKCHIL